MQTPPADNLTAFFTMMSALSAAVQQLVEHVFKKRWTWLDSAQTGEGDKQRASTVHLISFALGGVLAWSVGLQPLTYLGIQQPVFVNALAAGLLVSFGSSFVDEIAGAVRQFKKAQESLVKK